MGALRIVRRYQTKRGKAYRKIHFLTLKAFKECSLPDKLLREGEVLKNGLLRVVEWKLS
jgi:hypothetical protein